MLLVRGVDSHHVPTILPRHQPVGPIRQILVEQRRDARGELVAHRRIGTLQIRGQPRMVLHELAVVQKLEHAPRQHRRLER